MFNFHVKVVQTNTFASHLKIIQIILTIWFIYKYIFFSNIFLFLCVTFLWVSVIKSWESKEKIALMIAKPQIFYAYLWEDASKA